MPSTEEPQFGAVLKQQRQEAGLSMRELASAVGVNASTILRLETGRLPMPRPDQLNRLAQALGVEVEEFYAAAGMADAFPLPELGTYLRTKYGVTDADASRVEGYLQALRQRHDDTSAKEGHDDEHGGHTP